jgi:hypothetical protein
MTITQTLLEAPAYSNSQNDAVVASDSKDQSSFQSDVAASVVASGKHSRLCWLLITAQFSFFISHFG